MVRKSSFLKVLEGRTISLPISGTAANPSFRPEEALAALAKEAAAKAVSDKAGEALGGILGGGKESRPSGGTGGVIPENPLGGLFGTSDERKAQELLTKADALFDQGKKAEAAPVYKKIADKYKRTSVYKQNKDRVDARQKPE
jgi:hypothetical protein